SLRGAEGWDRRRGRHRCGRAAGNCRGGRVDCAGAAWAPALAGAAARAQDLLADVALRAVSDGAGRRYGNGPGQLRASVVSDRRAAADVLAGRVAAHCWEPGAYRARAGRLPRPLARGEV